LCLEVGTLALTRKGDDNTAGEGLVTRAWSDGTRGDGFKLREGRFR